KYFFLFFQAEDGIRDFHVTGVQTCALPISGDDAGGGRLQEVARDRRVDQQADLLARHAAVGDRLLGGQGGGLGGLHVALPQPPEIGRASCRERVLISGAATWVK